MTDIMAGWTRTWCEICQEYHWNPPAEKGTDNE